MKCSNLRRFWENDVEDILRYEDMRQEESPGGDYSYLDDEKRFINLLAIKDYGEAHQILKSLFWPRREGRPSPAAEAI